MANIYKRHSNCFKFRCGLLVDLDRISLIHPWSDVLEEVIFYIEGDFQVVDCSEKDYNLLVKAWKRTKDVYCAD